MRFTLTRAPDRVSAAGGDAAAAKLTHSKT